MAAAVALGAAAAAIKGHGARGPTGHAAEEVVRRIWRRSSGVARIS